MKEVVQLLDDELSIVNNNTYYSNENNNDDDQLNRLHSRKGGGCFVNLITTTRQIDVQ